MYPLIHGRALLVGFDAPEGLDLSRELTKHGMSITKSTRRMALKPKPAEVPLDLLVVSNAIAGVEGLAASMANLSQAYPATKLLLISDPLPREELLALRAVKIEAIVNRPYRTDLLVALVEALLEDSGAAFKTCPFCAKAWVDRETFLADKQLVLLGIQAQPAQPNEGYLLFNHAKEGCYTTLAVPVTRFFDLHLGPRFQQSAYATATCGGHCLAVESLAPCPAECINRTAREVMLTLLTHFKDR